jgi:hypothetical protein
MNPLFIALALVAAAGGGLLLLSAVNGLKFVDELYNNAPDGRANRR